MSITFTIAKAPTHSVPCPFCQEEWAEFPKGNGRGGKCDLFCTGKTTESSAPEVNFSNSNAAGVLALLGFKGESLEYGGCTPATLRQRIFRARHQDRTHLVSEVSYHPGGDAGVEVVQEGNVLHVQRMGAQMYHMGNTDEQTLGRLGRLEALALWAQEHGFEEITWG